MSAERSSSCPAPLPPPRRRAVTTTGLLAALAASTPAVSTPTGLNNIPTADTPGDQEVVFQTFANLRDERANGYWLGFKMGLRPLDQRLEFGADGRIGEGISRPPVLQFKYAMAFENMPTIALGVANVGVTSAHRDEVGQPFTYGVLTHDFDWLRGHVGYGLQSDNNSAFFGFDKTFQVFERDFMFRTDFIQIDDERQWLGSAGFIYHLDRHFAVESWISQPFEYGEPTFTLKLNVIFTF